MNEQDARPTEQKVDQLPPIESVGGKPRAHAVIYLEGRSFFVNLDADGDVVIGRSEEADVQLPTPTMSRRHFVLRWARGQLSVQDCGSTNGTYVNGTRLRGEVALAGGDQVTAGDALIVVGITTPQKHLHQLRPSEAFEERLSQALVHAARLGRALALVRLHIDGAPEHAAQGLATVLAALPGRPVSRAVGPTDYHVFVDEAVESVQGVCATLAGSTSTLAPRLTFGVATFPRDAQDLASLVRCADALVAPSAAAAAAGAAGHVAVDPASVRVFSLIDRVAPSESTVLVIGETGVGKEVVAREIHRRSPRAKGPFIAVNCGAIPTTMIARELFGHERGAFTGAEKRQVGCFEAAAGGTLFLDEVGEIPLTDQVHLLRAIEERSITRLGGSQPVAVDLRIVAATNRDLSELVMQGRFRQDLLYRLDVLTIMVPALRDRRGDVEPLAQHFLAGMKGARGAAGGRSFSPGAFAVLAKHGWPGNVRELRNVVERLSLLAAGPVISEMEVVEVLYGRSLTSVDFQHETDLPSLLASVERAAIERALRVCGGNQTLAAERLGISRRTLIYRMQEHGIRGPRSKE